MNPSEFEESAGFIRRRLEARKFMLRQVISQQQIDHMDIDVATDWLMGQFAVTLRTELYGEQLARATAEEHLEFPVTWWQHLKHDYAPDWFLARWPVKTKTWSLTVTANKWRIYPYIEKPLPVQDWGRSVEVVDPQTWSTWE